MADVAMQFDDAAQQRHAVTLGIWTFLVTEVMLFGGILTGYTVYRVAYPHAFAEASAHLIRGLGTLNTAILLTSSFTMVLAVRAAEHRRARALRGWLLATVFLGLCFLGVKSIEYTTEIREHLLPGAHFHGEAFSDPGRSSLFFIFYWALTGLHATHMLVGIGVLTAFAARVGSGRFTRNPDAIEVMGLYWHFVDIVWVFLFPLLYLIH